MVARKLKAAGGIPIKRCAVMIVLFTLAAIAFAMLLDISLVYPFIAAYLFSMFVLARKGWRVKDLLGMTWAGIFECRALFLFILLIGANISVWMASGVVPAMMYYGFAYLKGTNFILIAFLITGTMSVFMGTAVGTVSTLGIALLGIGRGFGLPQGLLAGVIVSGAFLADKISPISGLLNLTMNVTGTTYRQVMKTMARTLIPVLALTGAAYYLIGNSFPAGENGSLILYYQEAILEGFRLSPWLLLLPLGTVILPLKGVKIVPTVLAGLTGGFILTLTLQKTSLTDALNFMIRGYQAPSPAVQTILASGGVWGMTEVVFIVAAIIALTSILEKTGALHPLLIGPVSQTKTRGELIFKTGAIGCLLTAVTCDQTAGIVLQGRLYREKYHSLGVDDAVLARTISDTSTITAPLLPWNVNAVIVGLATGVSALDYAPYALLCYIFPLSILWIYGVEKFRLHRKRSAAEHPAGAGTE